MGEENVCMAFYTQPELIHDILKTIGNTAYRVLDEVSGAVQIDELFVHEDMAGKTGPLVGPAIIEEFIKPYYRRIWDLLQSRGARLFVQDSGRKHERGHSCFSGIGDQRPCIRWNPPRR